MKRGLEIGVAPVAKHYTEKCWALEAQVDAEEAANLCLELLMLRYGHAESVTVHSRSGAQFSICMSSGASSVAKTDGDRYALSLSESDVEAIMSFLVQYHRDQMAPVGHLDIELAQTDIPVAEASLCLKARVTAPSLSPEEAKKILDRD